MNDVKIFAKTIEQEAISQIYKVAKLPIFENSKIRIMPDAHAGAGCVIGFTSTLSNNVIPNLIGVDIGCGMLCVNLGKKEIDLNNLDSVIRKNVPHGRNNHVVKLQNVTFNPKRLLCYDKLKNQSNFELAIGSLGGGNHFIEIDASKNGSKFLIIHSGSRNLGHQVASYYQKLAFDELNYDLLLSTAIKNLIIEYKSNGKDAEIQNAINTLKATFNNAGKGVPRELCWLSGESYQNYLHDMKICQNYAVENRANIASIILSKLGYKTLQDDYFETIHNYIDTKQMMIRKGAIDASYGKKLLIPINMRDGCILGIGKGNEDWNCSAPHGAGRLMSRSAAKEKLSMSDYTNSMTGIFTTSVNEATLDEAPMAYKAIEEIVELISDTVDIVDIIKPIYNFKASE